MKEVILTPKYLLLEGYVIPFVKNPIVSLGVDKSWIDAHFIDPKRWVYVKRSLKNSNSGE